jgi:hypothetical protein
VKNSKFPRQTGLPRENPVHARHSPSAVIATEDDGIIGTSRGVPRYKLPYLARKLSVFFAPARYRVVKIACSWFEVVLRTMKNYKANYSLSQFRPCYEVIALHLAFFVLKKNNSLTMW